MKPGLHTGVEAADESRQFDVSRHAKLQRVKNGKLADSRQTEAITTADELYELFRYDPQSGDIWIKVRPGRARYTQAPVQGALLSVHRIVWCIATGAWPVQELDHINGDTHDNRLANLREVSSSENMHASRHRPNATSGIRGVHRRGSKFDARICVDGKYYRKSSFSDPKDAAAWIDQKAQELGVRTRVAAE